MVELHNAFSMPLPMPLCKTNSFGSINIPYPYPYPDSCPPCCQFSIIRTMFSSAYICYMYKLLSFQADKKTCLINDRYVTEHLYYHVLLLTLDMSHKATFICALHSPLVLCSAKLMYDTLGCSGMIT